MISWIQRSFQHHFRIIFGVLLAVTIISFIFTIGASPGIGRAGPKSYSQLFFGRDLSRQGTSESLYGDASLSAQLQAGFMPRESAQVQEYGLQRIAALALADQINIPAPTREDLANHIKGLGAFAGADGQFDANRYATFRDNLKTNPRLSEGDISRVLSDDVRIMRLQQILIGPGYVLPGEVRAQLALADSAWTIAVATLEYAAFKPDLPVAEDALKRFYDDTAFRYMVPPRVGVDYVEFPASAFLGAVSVTAPEVRASYDEDPARFPRPAEPKTTGDSKPLPADAAKAGNSDADFAAVRPQVEQALKNERALRQAAKAAADLTVTIYEQKLSPHTPAFDDFLAKNNLPLRPVAPFHRDAVPPELNWTPAIVEQALQLAADHPVSDAVSGPTGSLVFFWRETLPSYQPGLAQVRDRVVVDYRENERRKRFVELGRTFRSQLEARLKAGDPFDKAAAAVTDASQPKLVVKDYPSFLRRQPPKDIEPTVLGPLDRLERGQVSDMLLTEDRGFFVYVKEKKSPDLAETSPQFAATQAQLARLSTSLDRSLFLNEIVSRELTKNAPAAAR
jgi:peptidyl-prolyl cis-trans isomerase D